MIFEISAKTLSVWRTNISIIKVLFAVFAKTLSVWRTNINTVL